MSLFPDLNFNRIVESFRPKNPKGNILGTVVGSLIPGVGPAVGGRIGNVLGDVFSNNPREGGGSPDTAPTGEVITQPNQIPDIRPDMMPTVPGSDYTMRQFPGRSPMMQQANVVTGIFGQAARTLTRPGVQGLIGGSVLGSVVEFFVDEFGREKKLIITRKLQRDIKQLFKLSGGSFATTAFLYEEATGRQLTERQVIQIYTKRFSNQGPCHKGCGA